MKTLSFSGCGPAKLVPAALWLLALGATLGCSSVSSAKLPDGRYRIQCEKGMSDCVARADTLCKGKGYTVFGGQNATHRVGGSSSSYQGVIFLGDLIVACGAVTIPEPVCLPAPAADAVATTPPAAMAAATPTGGRVCVPGASQACVGAAGCAGGQACASDGQGFGTCDCGTSNVSSSVAPSAPAPVAPKIPGAAPAAEPLVAPRL